MSFDTDLYKKLELFNSLRNSKKRKKELDAPIRSLVTDVPTRTSVLLNPSGQMSLDKFQDFMSNVRSQEDDDIAPVGGGGRSFQSNDISPVAPMYLAGITNSILGVGVSEYNKRQEAINSKRETYSKDHTLLMEDIKAGKVKMDDYSGILTRDELNELNRWAKDNGGIKEKSRLDVTVGSEEGSAGVAKAHDAGLVKAPKYGTSFWEGIKASWNLTMKGAAAGLASFNKALSSTADVLIGNPLEALGWEDNPIHKIDDYYEKDYEKRKKAVEQAKFDAGFEKDDKVINVLTDVLEGSVAAAPHLILALMSGGSSLGASAGSLATYSATQTASFAAKFGMMIRGMMSNPSFQLSMATELGGNYEDAKANGASDTAAGFYAVISSMVNAGIEIGPEGTSGIQGLADDGGNALLKWITSTVDEGNEEVLQGFVSDGLAKIMFDEDREVLSTEKMAKEWGMGAAVSSVLGGSHMAGKAVMGGIDAVTNKPKTTENEQKVMDKLVEEEIANREKDGTKLDGKEKAAIRKRIETDLENGDISLDTIEEVLGGDTYTTHKETSDKLKALKAEYNELYNMKNGDKSDAQIARQNELQQEIEAIEKDFDSTKSQLQLHDEVYDLVKGDRLAESYNEYARRHQAFEADVSKYDEKQQKVIQAAIDSGILNNTNKTHKFVDWVAKVSADKGVSFDFANNQKLKESGFAKDGVTVNGLVTKDGVTLNIESAKALNKVVGHEVTHVLEGTELYTELQNAVTEYAKAKGEYDSRLKSLTELYAKHDPDADPVKELTADLVGDYLFTDTEFINNLTTKHRSLARKIYDEIKYMLKLATAGSDQARKLEKVKKAFAEAYRSDSKAKTETQYSISETTDGRFVAVVENDILSNIDTSAWDKAKKAEAKKAASDALKKFSGGIVVDGITRKVNKVSRREYTRSEYTEGLYNRSPEVFADKMRAADVADDIVVVATNWNRDGGLKHPRDDNFVDFDHGETLIMSGNAQYSAEVVVGITDTGEAVFYDVVDLKPTKFDIKKEESPTTATTQNAIGDIQGDSHADTVAQDTPVVKEQFSLSDSSGRVLPAEIQERLQYSMVRDESGRLKPMYHGSPNGNITSFKAGSYFTDNKEYADRYQNPGASSISAGKVASNPKTYEVYLDIRKPFDLSDAEAKRIYIENYIKGGNAIGINPYLSDAEYAKIETIDWTEGEDLRDFLIDNGYDYDGLVLDEGADGGYGDEVKYRGKSYVIFSPEQVVRVEQYSLSPIGETDTTGKYNVYGKDIALPSAMEDVAPVPQAEMAAETAETVQDVPIAEDVPVVSDEETEEMYRDDNYSVEQEIDTLAQQMVDLEGQLFEMAEAGQFGDEFNRISEEWASVKERLNALEQSREDQASTLDDTDAPPDIGPVYDEQTQTTPITKKLENDIARVVRSGLALSNKDMADVHRIIQGYVNGDISSRDQLFAELKRYNTYTETTSDDTVAEAKKELRGRQLKVDDTIKLGIADYGILQRSNFGKIRFSKDGLPVDVVYQELSGMYPHLFPENITVPEDQFLQMVDVANMDSESTQEHTIPDDEIMDVADAIIRSVREYRQTQQEMDANKHGRESFDSFMQEADQYIPKFSAEAYRRLSERPSVIDSDDIAPTFEIETDNTSEVEGQQAFLADATSHKPATRKDLQQGIIDGFKDEFHDRGYELDDVLKNAKNLSTWKTVDNTPQRVMEKALGYKEGQIFSDLTVNQAAQNETEGIKWLNSFTDRKKGVLAQLSRRYKINPGSKEDAAAQMYAEGFYVDDKDNIISYGDTELAADFKDPVVRARIKNLAKDPKIRQIYDETLAAINESRKRNGYPEIPRLDNYFLHFRAQTDTFSRIGLPFNPNDIRAKDLPTDLNGVTADLKPGQPYFASAMHRKGKRTSFDLLGGLERYLTSAKNQIYHIDDIQKLRALRNYIADTYGQANGLEGLDALTEEEQQERIEKVYDAHLSTFAKFLNEEANVLAGKTALIDRGLEGIIGRRGITFLDTLNKQVGSNMVGLNISSALTNFLAVAQAVAKSNKVDFVKSFGQYVGNKVGSIFGRNDGFTENSPVIIRRKGAERFHRTPFQKVGDAGYVLMGVVDNAATELIARTKYNELIRKGMDSQKAHFETDKWVSKLMGDRSLGQMPQLYNSKMLGLVTKFQLEVRNQLDSQFYDTIQETKASNEDIQNGLLRNTKTAAKVASTFFQLAVVQHLFGMAFESFAGYNPAFDIISVLMTAFGFDDDEESEDTALDNIEQGFMELLEDLPYTSTFLDGGRIPISSALPISELVTGEDQYGQEKSRWETLGEIAPYYILPGGYGQAKKTYQGLSMFDEDHPIAGSYTDNGDLRFPVDDTIGNRVQAALFGQWSNENAREYFDQERKPLNKKQMQEFVDAGLPIHDYWEYREGLSGLKTQDEKVDYINSLNITEEQKDVFKSYLFDEEGYAKDNPEKYAFLENEGIGYLGYKQLDSETQDSWSWAFKHQDEYEYYKSNGIMPEDYSVFRVPMLEFDDESDSAYEWAFDNQDKAALGNVFSGGVKEFRQYAKELDNIKADKYADGREVSGSAKRKKWAYIDSLDIDAGAKSILFKREYPSEKRYNTLIVEYLNSRDDISYEEMESILIELGFDVDSEGNIIDRN